MSDDTGIVWWFGPKPFAPICDLTPARPTPVGSPCACCGRPFVVFDSGFLLAASLEIDASGRVPYHRKCLYLILGIDRQ